MIIILIGPSGSGKSTIENEFTRFYNFKKVTSYTTRSPRDGEINGKDYHFITNEEFEKMIENSEFAEWDEYSQNRLYGTKIADFTEGNKVVVLTPNGFRQLKKNLPPDVKMFSVLVDASLGTRMIRYITRCGIDKFNFDDKNEICSRVERDFGMFLGLENEVDMIVKNDEGTDIVTVTKLIVDEMKNKYHIN